FAEYTGISAAAVMALLAAAKTFKELEGNAAARADLERDLKKLIGNPPNASLHEIASLHGESKGAKVDGGNAPSIRYPQLAFWQDLFAGLPQYALPRLALAEGDYVEMPWDEALLTRRPAPPITIFRASPSSGVELLIANYIAALAPSPCIFVD